MENDEHNPESKSRQINALEEVILALSRRVQTPYNFRFVSTGQATPLSKALFAWERGGRSGPRPVGSVAQNRAVIYSLARPASQLRAFPKVASVVAVELAQAAVAGLRASQISVPYTALRGFIERTAHAWAIAEAVSGIKAAPLDGPLTPVLELSDIINKGLYGTQREWQRLASADFRKTSPKETKYVREDGIADAKAIKVLTSIDKLDKRVVGARLVYEILCEFLHPNIGDLWAATLEGKSTVDAYGTRHIVRVLGLGSKTLEGLRDQQAVLAKAMDICTDVILQMPLALDEIEATAQVATILTRKSAHKVVKDHRDYFANADLCPCLSGLTVKECRRSVGR